MKKHLHGIIAVLLMLCVCSGAVAEGTTNPLVSFEKMAAEFVFLPSNDLFPNFKNAMPGDTLTQTIEVMNNRGVQAFARIYLRADPVDEAQKAFLDQLDLKVTDLNTGEIFNAKASETAQLTENVLLGFFRFRTGTTLEVELTIPKDLGDEFQAARGDVHWVFTAEIVPIEYRDTGDWFDLKLWAAAGGLVLGALLGLLIVWRRRNRSEEPEEG